MLEILFRFFHEMLRHSDIRRGTRCCSKQRYPSGQRGWDEVPVRSASQVQILSSAPFLLSALALK